MMQKIMAMTSIHHSRRTSMNCTQDEKLNQVTPHILIVGVDIAKFKHVARAQDDPRLKEYWEKRDRKVFNSENTLDRMKLARKQGYRCALCNYTLQNGEK